MSLSTFCARYLLLFKSSANILPKRCSTILKTPTRFYGKEAHALKVTVCGAAGNVGQPLCLMLKQSPLIEELCLFDTVGVCGLATELSHIDTKCKVVAYSGMDRIREAFEGASVIVVVAATPRTSVLSHSAMFDANANIIKEIANRYSTHNPKALLAIATNPVNSMVPLASEVLKKNGTYNYKTIFGVTALDVVRTNTFVAEVQGLEPECVAVPVIGGNTNNTIVPILSQAKPCDNLTNEELEKITEQVKKAHGEIIKAKSKQSATLSSAFAIARFVISLVKGIKGYANIVECAYVRSLAHPHCKYLSTPIRLGPGGIQKNLGLPQLSEYERCQLQNAVEHLNEDIKKAEKFLGIEDPPVCDPCDPSPGAPPCPPDFCAKAKQPL